MTTETALRATRTKEANLNMKNEWGVGGSETLKRAERSEESERRRECGGRDRLFPSTGLYAFPRAASPFFSFAGITICDLTITVA